MRTHKRDKDSIEDRLVFIEVEEESVSAFNKIGFIIICLVCVWLLSPDFRSVVNPFISQFIKSSKEMVSNKPDKGNEETKKNNSSENKDLGILSVKYEKERPNKERKQTDKTLGVNNLFANVSSVGSRFIGLAEGNVVRNESGGFNFTSNYYGHVEPSKAVKEGTINYGFCSTPVSVSGSEEERLKAGNLKCLSRLNALLREGKRRMKLGNEISRTELVLLLNAIDMGNQAREETRNNLYSKEIPTFLKSGEDLTLVRVTRMRTNAFYSNKDKKLKTALTTIPALVKLAEEHCGVPKGSNSQVEEKIKANVIAVDQARRVAAANKVLESIGMGLQPMTRKEIMNEVCLK